MTKIMAVTYRIHIVVGPLGQTLVDGRKNGQHTHIQQQLGWNHHNHMT